jgi:hypothetical protein
MSGMGSPLNPAMRPWIASSKAASNARDGGVEGVVAAPAWVMRPLPLLLLLLLGLLLGGAGRKRGTRRTMCLDPPAVAAAAAAMGVDDDDDDAAAAAPAASSGRRRRRGRAGIDAAVVMVGVRSSCRFDRRRRFEPVWGKDGLMDGWVLIIR